MYNFSNNLKNQICNNFYGETEQEKINEFIDTAKRYIKAVEERRLVTTIGKVAPSGLSRTVKFIEVQKNVGTLNFYVFFKTLGFEQVKNSNYFRVHGCGMNMIFDTHYKIVMKLKNSNIIKDKRANKLINKSLTTI